ncbi:hypothetical protein GCM10010304_77400 [Streptomyces roseoviolaceus]
MPFVLALPALWSPAAHGAITAINAVGMIPESFNYAGVTLAIALVPAWLTRIARGRRDCQLTTHASTAQQGGLEEDV